MSGSALSLFPLVLELLGIAAALRSFAAFFTIRRRLRRGVPSRRDGSWRWVASFNIALLSLAGAFLLFSIWFFCASFTNDGWEGELDLVSEPLSHPGAAGAGGRSPPWRPLPLPPSWSVSGMTPTTMSTAAGIPSSQSSMR